jgi:hypothetical protein
MDTSEFNQFRAFRVDTGWYHAQWQQQRPATLAGHIVRAIASMTARFRSWSACKFQSASPSSAWLSFD